MTRGGPLTHCNVKTGPEFEFQPDPILITTLYYKCRKPNWDPDPHSEYRSVSYKEKWEIKKYQ